MEFPPISPEIFSLNFFGFNFVLRWYAVSYIAGFFCAIILMKYFLRRAFCWADNNPPMTPEQADSLLTYLILGVIIGGRLGYVIFYNLEYYLGNPLSVIRIWDGGMAFHGGFLGVIFSVFLYCRYHRIDLWPSADLIALATPPGLFFGRLANFINAELWGRPTDAPWGVIFPGERAKDCYGMIAECARHPTQLYEAILEGLILFAVIFFMSSKGALRRPKLVTGTFAFGYGISRFFVEYFRVPDPQFFSNQNPYGYAYELFGYGATMGQMLSIPMIFVGLLLMFTAFLSGQNN